MYSDDFININNNEINQNDENYYITMISYFNKIKNDIDSIISKIADAFQVTKIQSFLLCKMYNQNEIENLPAISVGEIANLLGIEQANASSLLKIMENKDLIIRTRATFDERRVEIKLSENGKKIAKNIINSFAPYENLIKTLEKQKYESIITGIKKTAELLEEMKTLTPQLSDEQ